MDDPSIDGQWWSSWLGRLRIKAKPVINKLAATGIFFTNLPVNIIGGQPLFTQGFDIIIQRINIDGLQVFNDIRCNQVSIFNACFNKFRQIIIKADNEELEAHQNYFKS